MKKIIVKVQLPIVSNSPDAGILVYNEDHTIMQELPIRSPEELKMLRRMLGGELKGYFYAKFEGKGLILISKAPWQDW